MQTPSASRRLPAVNLPPTLFRLAFLLGLLTQPHAATPAPAPSDPEPSLTAKWIWRADGNVHAYNQTIVARRDFRLHQPSRAVLRITADSWYRVLINDSWINDGPARAWPEHFQYDLIDVTPFLRDGRNEIRVIARWYGVGDFHHVPQQAGLLAQLDVTEANGHAVRIGTDAAWEVAEATPWIVNTPKVSIQMEPVEIYDANREAGLRFRKAGVLFGATQGPWRDLAPRDTALLTRQPVTFRTFRDARIVHASGWNFLLPAARLVNPGLIEANHTASQACGMATILDAPQPVTLRLQSEGMKIAIDGQRIDGREQTLAAGRHLVLAFVQSVCDHEKHKGVRFLDPRGFQLANPVRSSSTNPWVFLRFPEFAFATNDLNWIGFRQEDRRVSAMVAGFEKLSDDLLTNVRRVDDFAPRLGARAEVLPGDAMFLIDPTWQFQKRRVVGDARPLVRRPAGLINDNHDATVVSPSPDGDVELCYDLGAQDCGYYDFTLEAEGGVQVDIFGVEYIAPDGRIQHTQGNRNGLRYLTKPGVNRFTSLKRRSGRYVFVTLRNQKAPVTIRHLGLIESTYPVQEAGAFACSDARLDEIWSISTRTLKLCMEDTFTDCPLYEQTHWVGDARNESLLAYGVFGAPDLARRCIDITAQSLDRYPIAGCQTPSGWDVILPAWSFLWGISTWDHFWYTADTNYLRTIYPAVIRNLKGAERYVNDRDLFSAPFWNFFDWVNIDQGPKTVLHNSLFLVGAIDAALREARVLNDPTHVAWLESFRARLVGGINRLWDPARQAYPDSIHDDGSLSASICQHTSFLGLLYDVVPAAQREAARRNLLAPPEKMVRPGSPFAVLYLYEAYEKLGLDEEIIRDIYRNYLPMLAAGATTVWESFPSGTTGGDGFPTRSHCHAWSSAPTRFLNRIILGVRETAPGGERITLSPRLNGLDWARGRVVTARGVIAVDWKKTGTALELNYTAPPDVTVEFQPNDSLQGLKISLNGRPAA